MFLIFRIETAPGRFHTCLELPPPGRTPALLRRITLARWTGPAGKVETITTSSHASKGYLNKRILKKYTTIVDVNNIHLQYIFTIMSPSLL